MNISEVFESLQGEGAFAGYPVLFIRTSGCNRNCEWCDSKYHKDGKEISVEKIIEVIKKSKMNTVVWTGGEPTLQINDIIKVIIKTPEKEHHLETNGDIYFNKTEFDHISYSPKDKVTAKIIFDENMFTSNDIKIVTDLETVGMDMLKYATMLMPLTTNDKKENREIEKDVWNYCVNKDKRFCLRQHLHVWGNKKGV